MWLMRTTLELRMKLRTYHEWMILHLDDLHNARLRPDTREDEAAFFQTLAEGLVKLVAMTMALRNEASTIHLLRISVCVKCLRPLLQFASVRTEAKCATFALIFVLIRQKVHDVFVMTK